MSSTSSSSSAPFDTGLVIDRLATAGDVLSELREIKGVAGYSAVKSLRDFPAPAAYVLLASERGTPGPGASTRQKADVVVGIALAVRNWRDAAEEREELNRFLGALRERLIGWVPDLPGARGFEFIQGDLMDYDDSTLLWVEVYGTQHFIGARN